MCIDGTQAGIYIFDPDQLTATPNKLMIYFQGLWEGWCPKSQLNTSLDHCFKYVNSSDFIDYGSSDNWAGSTFFLNGILSAGSIFASWPKVLIKSCDGGSYFSDTSVTYKGKILNFRGKKNVIQAINLLNNKKYLANRDQILIVGPLNGGIAALSWANYIKSFTKAKVRIMGDASVWENDVQQKTKTQLFQNRMKSMQKLFINGTFPNQKCQQANPDSIYKCFYSTQLVKYVDSSIQILFLQSLYDGWAIDQILGLKCAIDFGSLSQCTTAHRDAIQSYHKKVNESLTQMSNLENVCVFGIACVAHQFTNGRFNDQSFQVPMNSNNTAQNVVISWLASKNSKKYIDNVQWPNNKQCARKAVSNLKEQ